MKKYFILLLSFLLQIALKAQIKKQSILLGGNFNYYSSENKNDNLNQKTRGGTINVAIGRAFRQNQIWGINIGVAPLIQSHYFSDTANLKVSGINAGLFYRSYKSLAKNFYFFNQIDGTFTSSTNTQTFFTISKRITDQRKGILISYTPGISYQISKKTQVELLLPNIFSMQYMVANRESQIPEIQNYKRNEFSVSSNLNTIQVLSWLGLGFRFIL